MIMAAESRRQAHGARRWVRGPLLAGALAALFLGALALYLVAGRSTASPAPSTTDASALRAYTNAIRPLFAGAGEITEMEMKPSISDFNAGRLSGSELAARAVGWQQVFARTGAGLRGLSVPEALRGANRQFEGSMSGYALAASWLQRAGQASDPLLARSDMGEAVAAAQQADRTFDMASATVQAALRAAQLPADPDLPGGA